MRVLLLLCAMAIVPPPPPIPTATPSGLFTDTFPVPAGTRKEDITLTAIGGTFLIFHIAERTSTMVLAWDTPDHRRCYDMRADGPGVQWQHFDWTDCPYGAALPLVQAP
jgi:hypothetical protein